MLSAIINAIMNFGARVATQWQTLAAALAIGLVLGGGVTWRVMAWKEGAAQTAQARTTIRFIERSDMASAKLGTVVIRQVTIAQANTAQLLEEIPQHVTPQMDSDYPVPLGFVRVWNSAAHGPIPEPAAGADAEPSGIPLSDVAASHTEDEGTLDLCRIRLTGWQDWYREQSALWNASVGVK
jgi:hypothetical protein